MSTITTANQEPYCAEKKKMPKVLIIGQPFNNDTGGGITLSNLFAGWDRERLAVVCSGYLINDNTSYDRCRNYYQIGHLEHRWTFPFSVLKRKYYSGPVNPVANPAPSPLIGKDGSSWRKKLITEHFHPLMSFLGIQDFLSSVKLSPQLCRWIDQFEPDVVYAQATSRQGILFCKMVQEYVKKPFVFHMMDDWPLMLKEEGILGRYWEKKVHSEIQDLFDNAQLLLSISDRMAIEYKQRYGKNFITFHNPIDLTFWSRYRKTDFNLKKRPSLLYAGRVGIGINSSLQTIAKAVRQLNEETGADLEFLLQTAEEPAWVKDYDCVRHTGLVPYDELPKAFAQADFLILPYDFSSKALQFIRLSMPTKATEYMASGTPLIVFAPETTALVNYAKTHQCARILTENKAENLKEILKELMLQPLLRQTLSEKATETVDHHHNAVEVQEHFRSLIGSLI